MPVSIERTPNYAISMQDALLCTLTPIAEVSEQPVAMTYACTFCMHGQAHNNNQPAPVCWQQLFDIGRDSRDGCFNINFDGYILVLKLSAAGYIACYCY